MPRADIGPAAIDWHDGGARGLFHHRVVDGDGFRRFECARIQRDKSEIASSLDHGIGDGLHAFGIDVAVFVEQNGCAKHEVAAVPEITGLDIFSGRYRIRLLDELRDGTDLAGNRLARADITVLGGRPLGLYTKRNDIAG